MHGHRSHHCRARTPATDGQPVFREAPGSGPIREGFLQDRRIPYLLSRIGILGRILLLQRYHAFWRMYGLDLPDEILKKLYYKNALRIIPGLDASLFPK